jgi:hypothetical protein
MTRALEGTTPYEAINHKKPHLADLQEFGAAAYVKDISAGKLDSRSQVGRFVGYDSESKGYRIYWPTKRKISIERNVVFNQDDVRSPQDTIVIPGDALAEGERDKILQSTPANPPPVIEPDNAPDKLSEQDDPPNISDPAPVLPLSNTPEPDEPEEPDEPNPDIVYTKRSRHQQGFYKQTKTINKNLSASYIDVESEGELENDLGIILDGDDLHGLPQEYALAGAFGHEPKTLHEALETSNAKEWQAAHEYEIGQLQKLKTWVIVDLPKGQYAIPHSEVFHEKRGPSGNIETFRA